MSDPRIPARRIRYGLSTFVILTILASVFLGINLLVSRSCFMLFDDMVAEGTGWGYPFPSRFVVERYGQPPLCLWCFWNLATDLVLAAIALALAGWRLERWFGRLRRNATTPSREWSFAWRPALVVFCGLLITNLLWERQGGMSVLMGGYSGSVYGWPLAWKADGLNIASPEKGAMVWPTHPWLFQPNSLYMDCPGGTCLPFMLAIDLLVAAALAACVGYLTRNLLARRIGALDEAQVSAKAAPPASGKNAVAQPTRRAF